ncbi:MAG: hypothetical protein J0L51_02890 [Rhizobiales bacterium]|nr:hypothetical protein [Hyphomicrobiales bacterium]
MGSQTSALSAADPVIDLRRKHQAFLARIGTNPPGADEIAAFMDELQSAGRLLPDTPEDKRRSTVRNMLFYWAGDAIARGHRPKNAPLPQLADFAGESAGATHESGIVPERIADDKAESGNREPAAESAGSAPPESVPVSSPEKSQGDKPLTDIEAIARARIILRYGGSARQWKQTPPEKRADYLLTGNRLAEASLYVQDDPDIRAHVEASEKARDAARDAEITRRSKLQRQRIGILTGLVVFAFSMVGALWWKSIQLQEALDEAEKQRQAAVAALSARDRADREKAAAFEVLEDPELRLRQSQRQQADAPPTASNISEAPRRPAPPAGKPEDVPVPIAVAEPCSGYLWLGSPSDSRLLNGQSPAALKPGDKVTISLANDIRLREAPPSFNYQMGRQNGLVPGGSSVTIESLLTPYQRPSGAQYWAQVLVPRQFCTSVFVQFAGAMPAQLDAIKGELLNLGVQTPEAEELSSARGKAEVRYYWASDWPVAQQVATALGKFTKDGKPLRLTPLTDFPPAAKAKATTIEVWLDLDLLKP